MRLVLASVVFCSLFFRGARAEVSFNRDVRPILAEHCIECHGPAKAKGGLRLDQQSSTTNVLKSGSVAIKAREPGNSEVLRRLQVAAGEDRMPPAESGKKALAEREIAVIEQWITEGAKWDGHWAFAAIRKPPTPLPAYPDLARNAIDAFVQKELVAAGVRPSVRADERTLSRRVAFDLAALPPFLEAPSWEEKVDAYLAAPSFGERMALWWLDLVRYADSEGYFYDSHRNIYPYRDYVIRSFNTNKRFDRFTAEQIAGDLLPNAGFEEKIASGYNRLILTTHEAGANDAEYRARYASDRVRNIGSVWLGLTLGCAECHDHKFDPISTGDFYRMAAFFADINEEAIREQPEIYLGIESPDYRALVEKTEALSRIQVMDGPEIACEQTLAEQEYIRCGKAPDYWPKGKRSDYVASLIAKKNAGKTSAAEERDLGKYFARHFRVQLQREISQLMTARLKFESNADRSLITERGAPRTVRILARGNWMDQSGPQVFAAFPKFLKPANSDDLLDRADLANWLTARDNPLTARVLANRLWQLFFGVGLVRTPDDFGAQGDSPGNPQLLEYLASELIENGWDIKHVVRLIVTSHTYQQSSSSPPELVEKDPDNRLFARQNCWRLTAETTRDNALAISGLISRRVEGPPVKLYATADYRELVDLYADEPYASDAGERLYRRALFLYRKRSYPHPSLAAFNASSREECTSQRAQTQSPQVALALLNAPVFVECARALAERIYDAAKDDGERLNAGFNFALSRDPTEKEASILLALLEQQRKSFAANTIGAAKSIRTGQYRWPTNIGAADLGAWTDVARAILNLDETNTRY